MKTLVNVAASWQDGSDSGGSTHSYLMEGSLSAGEAEDKLRDAVDSFFARAGESAIREAWDASSGDFNWGDCLGVGYGTDYFEANGIVEVAPGQSYTFDRQETVFLRHDEHLFPDEWEDKMREMDAAERASLKAQSEGGAE